MQAIIEKEIQEHQTAIAEMRAEAVVSLIAAAEMCKQAFTGGGKLLFCGNGGSAADSQHLAAELVGRFRRKRNGLPALALTTDTSVLTSVGNDDGFDQVFARQVEALGREGDVLIGISTSGNSENVLRAIKKAKTLGIRTIAMTGGNGGKLRGLCDLCLNVSAPNTARVQEGHILLGHILCELLDAVRDD